MKKLGVISIRIFVLLLLLPCANANSQELQSAIRLTRSEQYSKAELAFKSILQKNPKDGRVYFYYGENFLQKYFTDSLGYSFPALADSATKIFHAGAVVDADNPLNYVGLGELALMNKKFQDAQSYFDKANSLLPSKTNKKSSLSKEEQAEVLLNMATSYLRSHEEDSTNVFQLLRKAGNLDKKNYDIYIATGDAYIQLQNNGTKAIQNYEKAQELNPQSPRAKLKIGELWSNTKNYPLAQKYFSEAIQIDTNYAPAYRAMGYLLLKTDKMVEARGFFEKYFYLSTGDKNTRIQYINILLDLHEYSEAIKQINVVMQKDTLNNDFNRALGYSYYETGQYEKGLNYMSKFFANTKPANLRTEDYTYYGKLLAKNEQDSLAGEILLKAYQMDTSQTDLLNQALSEIIKQKNYNEAVEVILKKIEMKKDVAFDYYILGQLYYNLHDWQKADSALSINISMDPGNVKGYLWKAYSLVNLDPDTKEGLAKPAFEMLIEKARSDSVKYSSELVIAYSYLAYYYLVQFVKTKNQQDSVTAKSYCETVLAIDPSNEKAKAILKELTPVKR